MLDGLSRADISTALGYSSIVAWLFAQAPQVIENYRNGSVEGLALPFLTSWLAGDVTNLVGCILTHQLPFQTYLAIYFVFIDMCLMAQYIYYTHKNPVPTLPPLSESYPHAQAPEHAHHAHHHRHSHSRRPSSSNRRRGKTSGAHGHRLSRSKSAGGEDPMTRSWMSEMSADHSPSSTRPASAWQQSRPTSTRHNTYDSAATKRLSRQSSSNGLRIASVTMNSANIGSDPAPGVESPSPTVPERGRTLTRPPRPRGPHLETISGSPASGSPVAAMHTHQQLTSAAAAVAAYENSYRSSHSRTATSTSRSRPPRRTASMLFLSVGFLMTFSKLANVRRGMLHSDLGQGTVWATLSDAAFDVAETGQERTRAASEWSDIVRRSEDVSLRLYASDEPAEKKPPGRGGDGDHDERPYPDYERFIGRASAWLCTTLYLTSRLPQIWTNFRRRSVEGLSMLLFIMAFTGNSLYVMSILSNPLMGAPGYLLESTPYLLGSGGTLCFDITIVMQSLLYSEKRKAAQERRRRRKEHFSVDVEEQAALLQTDNEHDETEDDMRDDSTIGQMSSRQSSLGPQHRSRSGRRSASRKSSFQSTELDRRTLTRAERGLLDDEPFDFDVEREQEEQLAGRVSGSTSRSRTRPSSLMLDSIAEGESAIVLRED